MEPIRQGIAPSSSEELSLREFTVDDIDKLFSELEEAVEPTTSETTQNENGKRLASTDISKMSIQKLCNNDVDLEKTPTDELKKRKIEWTTDLELSYQKTIHNLILETDNLQKELTAVMQFSQSQVQIQQEQINDLRNENQSLKRDLTDSECELRTLRAILMGKVGIRKESAPNSNVLYFEPTRQSRQPK
jgi:hypothetical protein